MGIHNNIRNQTIFAPRQIIGGANHSNSSLLPVPTRELITQFRNTHFKNTDMHKTIAICLMENRDFFHASFCENCGHDTSIPNHSRFRQSHVASNEHSLVCNNCSLLNNTIIVQHRIINTRSQGHPTCYNIRITDSDNSIGFRVFFFYRIIRLIG